MIDVLALALVGFGVFAVLAWLGNLYSRRTGWQPPAGSADPNSSTRRNLSLAVGALSAVMGALFCAIWVQPWPARLLMVFESSLLAAAGASDLRRFHLPLPFTMLGIVVALIMVQAFQLPSFFVIFGVAWALVIILLHSFTSKGSMQLGDHVATLWIALAAPFNGLIAVMLGDFANVVLVRVKDLRGKKVAAAGMWLVCAAALAGLPPYLAWFSPAGQVTIPTPVNATADVTWHVMPTKTPVITAHQAEVASALVTLTEWAADHTGRLALIAQRSERIAAAQQQAIEIGRYGAFAQQIAPGCEIARALQDLSTALKNYDVAQVRDASERLAQQRETLLPVAAVRQTPQVEADNTETNTVQETQ